MTHFSWYQALGPSDLPAIKCKQIAGEREGRAVNLNFVVGRQGVVFGGRRRFASVGRRPRHFAATSTQLGGARSLTVILAAGTARPVMSVIVINTVARVNGILVRTDCLIDVHQVTLSGQANLAHRLVGCINQLLTFGLVILFIFFLFPELDRKAQKNETSLCQRVVQ